MGAKHRWLCLPCRVSKVEACCMGCMQGFALCTALMLSEFRKKLSARLPMLNLARR